VVPRLLDLAREDFPETVDLIFEGELDQAQEGDAELPDDAVERAQMAAAYALAVPNPPWLKADLSDEQFLNELTTRAAAYARAQAVAAAPEPEVEVLGPGSWLGDLPCLYSAVHALVPQ
jgi:hypothetical protein